ncbi:hypothetical protein [Synechococcus elongatus]|uniref:hypothetical protein n=1 Tax=Synechococcus elongatus TaxID=32046 RepID=UPI0012DDEF9C|nr:hypothetical protein [Synechococcus elongatus]
MKGVVVSFLAIALIGCRTDPSASLFDTTPLRASRLKEVPPPALVADLSRSLDQYQPQVKILSPKPDQVIESDRVEVKLQVRDYPLFLNEQWQMGPHLHLILDNEPYQAIYDVGQPIELTDLQPGTHTLRVFASRPWHESFKNEGAYAQVSFSVFTPTESDRPNLIQPLLTYSRPKGSYGAEPVMLDFYLTNAPLHSLAQADDEIEDWQIRVTVNGESFRTEDWQPIYLEGLKPGRNWVKLELLDERGQPRSGPFNTTVRLIDYQPGGQAVLDRSVRGNSIAAKFWGLSIATTCRQHPNRNPRSQNRKQHLWHLNWHQRCRNPAFSLSRRQSRRLQFPQSPQQSQTLRVPQQILRMPRSRRRQLKMTAAR